MIEKGVRGWRILDKYKNACTHLNRFTQYRYHKSDISFKELTEDSINKPDFYLRVDKALAQDAIWVCTMPFYKMIKITADKDVTHRNLFKDYTNSMEEKNRGHLPREGVETLLQYHPEGALIELTRDLFVSSCFTGFFYVDIK